MGDKRIHSNDKKNDDVEQLKLHLTKILDFLPLLNTHLTNILARMEICMATNRDSSTAPAVRNLCGFCLSTFPILYSSLYGDDTKLLDISKQVTDTTANKDAMNRMKVIYTIHLAALSTIQQYLNNQQ